MTGWELPQYLNISGKEYEIRSDYRAVLDVLMACNDPELNDEVKAWVMLTIMIPDLETIPPEHLGEAGEKVGQFIDCGQQESGKPHPRLIDWEQDASIIVSAVNSVAHTEIRALPYLHWWSFWAYFMEIRESLFSSVLSIRKKKASRKKLERYEEEYYRENRGLIDLRNPESEAEKAEKENIMKWL